jgi:hypothetical protein
MLSTAGLGPRLESGQHKFSAKGRQLLLENYSWLLQVTKTSAPIAGK